MLFPGPERSCFWLDPAAGLTDGGLWKDSSPYGLHVTPVGYASPAYGISTGPSGAKRITFNGAQQGDLPLAFWASFPSAAATWVMVARHTAAANGERIFFARSGAPFNGMELIVAPGNRLRVNGYSAGNNTGCVHTADVPLAGRTRVTILSCTAPTAARIIGGWTDRDGVAMTDVAGAGVSAWGSSVGTVPNIGSAAGGNFWAGDLYFLALFPFIFTHSEAVAMSDFWRDRT